MLRYRQSSLITNWSLEFLNLSSFFSQFPAKITSSPLKLFSIATLPQPMDYSSGEEKPNNNNGCSKISNRCTSNDVVRKLHNLKKNPKITFSFIRDIENLGFHHDLSTYSAIVIFLFKSKLKRGLVSLLSDLISSGGDTVFEISALFGQLVKNPDGSNAILFTIDALFKAYQECRRDPIEAINAFLQLSELGFRPLPNSLNFLLYFASKNGNLDIVFTIFSYMERFRLKPDAYSFTILIKSLCKARKPEGAIQVLNQMEKIGVKPDRITYITFLSGLCLCKNSSLGYAFLEEIAKEGLIPLGSIDYNMVIDGLCKEMRLDEAEKLLESMAKQNIPPDQNGYGYLIRGHCEKGDLLKALNLYEVMVAKGIEANPSIVTQLLQCFRKLGLNSEALFYFKKFRDSGIRPDRILYNVAIDAYSKMGEMREAMVLLNEMRIDGFAPDQIHYTCLISGYCHMGDMVNARKVFDEMVRSGERPDLVTYNALASGLCKNGLVDEAFDLLDHMVDQGVEPSPVSYGIVIEGSCKRGWIDQAEALFKAVRREGTSRTGASILYSYLISGYLHLGRTSRAYELFYEFSEQGNLIDKISCGKLINELCKEGNIKLACKVADTMIKNHHKVPDILSYGKIITSFCQRGDLKSARFYFEDLHKQGLMADVFIYTTLMNGFCKAGFLQDACELFVEMTRVGIKPDVVAFTVLLDGHLKSVLEQGWSGVAKEKKNFEIRARVSRLANEMVGMEIEPDVICYTVLIDGQCKMDYLKDAHEMFDEMVRTGVAPDVCAYTALINGYVSQGEIAKAESLFQEMVDRGIKPDTLAFAVLEWGALNGRKLERRN